MNARHWTEGEVAQLLSLLPEYRRADLPRLAQRLTDYYGRPITIDQMTGVLRRRGKGSPASFCSDGVPAIDRDPPSCDDGPATERSYPSESLHTSGAHFEALGPSVKACSAPPHRDAMQPPPHEPKPWVGIGAPDTEPPPALRYSRAPGPVVADELQKILIIPDVHRPYHNKSAWALLLRFAHQWKPDVIAVMGDFADCYAVSFHDKDPSRLHNLKAELADVNVGFDELDAIGAGRKIAVEGNHEARGDRYIAQRCPELHGMVSMREAMGIDRRGWEWVPYRSHTNIGQLQITHECGNAGPLAHIKARDSFGTNVVISHTHRMAVSYAGDVGGSTNVGAMFGWLGDAAEVSYMHKIAMRGWQLGFGTGRMESNGVVHLQAHPIISGKVVVEGRLYS